MKILKKKAFYIPAIIVLILIISVGVYSAIKKPNYTTAKVESKDFVQEVSVTGKVVAANDVNLGFESGGKVSGISVSVGQKVTKGQTLAYVGSGDLYASLLGAQARLQSAQADLNATISGTHQLELYNTEDSFNSAKINLIFAIKNSFAISDDVIRSKVDIMFENPTGSYPKFPTFGDSSRRAEIEKEKVAISDLLQRWNKSNGSLNEDNLSEEYVSTSKSNLNTISLFIEDLAYAASNFDKNQNLTDAQIASYVNNISSARASINNAISTLNSVSQAYTSAKGKLDVAQGSKPEDIERAEASVKSAQASVLQAQAALAKTTVSAPFTGVITKTDLKVGQFVSPGTPVISMISDANFEIESYIPEADIAKVKIGDVGTTTLDAYGDNVTFSVVVSDIDLSETEVDGVATYKTTLQFVESDERIRSGMTANVDLVSAHRSGVLSIPQSALINKAGKRTVLVYSSSNKKPVSQEVTTGSIDSDGNLIEIKSGLKLGDTVVTNPLK